MEKAYQKARKRYSASSNDGSVKSGGGSMDENCGDGSTKKSGVHARRKSSRRQGRKGSVKRRKSGLAFLSGITPYSNLLTAHDHGRGRVLFCQHGYGMPSDKFTRSSFAAQALEVAAIKKECTFRERGSTGRKAQHRRGMGSSAWSSLSSNVSSIWSSKIPAKTENIGLHFETDFSTIEDGSVGRVYCVDLVLAERVENLLRMVGFTGHDKDIDKQKQMKGDRATVRKWRELYKHGNSQLRAYRNIVRLFKDINSGKDIKQGMQLVSKFLKKRANSSTMAFMTSVKSKSIIESIEGSMDVYKAQTRIQAAKMKDDLMQQK